LVISTEVYKKENRESDEEVDPVAHQIPHTATDYELSRGRKIE